MITSQRIGSTAIYALLAVLIAPSFGAPPQRTLPVDPVELIAGRDVPGRAELSVERDGIEYRFATDVNKSLFEKDPAKYEVADGGACGRMGALSGMGDARRYAVHDGRIYFFASDGCRTGFLKDPAAYIEHDDDKVFGSNDQVVRGRAALDRVVQWAGGAERIRAVTSYRAALAKTEKHGDKEYAVARETVIAFPDRYFQKESWNESWFSTLLGPDGAAMASVSGAERIAASRGRAFQRSMSRWPIVVLKAHADGSPRADCPGLIVIGEGDGVLGETPVEYIRVWLNGAAMRLTIDRSSGKPLQLAFRGRDGTMKVGESVRTFTAWSTIDGVTLPTAYTVYFDGKESPQSSWSIDAFEINPTLPADRFVMPEH